MEINAAKLQRATKNIRAWSRDLNSIRIPAIDLLGLDERARLYSYDDDDDVYMLLLIVTILFTYVPRLYAAFFRFQNCYYSNTETFYRFFFFILNHKSTISMSKNTQKNMTKIHTIH